MRNSQKIVFLVLLNLAVVARMAQIPADKIVEISPSALDVMTYSFDYVVAYFHDYKPQDLPFYLNSQRFKSIVQVINQTHPEDHVLFGYVNLTNDHNNYLSHYKTQKGIHIISTVQQISFAEGQFNDSDIIQSYEVAAHPKMALKYSQQAINQKSDSPYKLIFYFTNVSQIQSQNNVYSLIHSHIHQIPCFLVPAKPNQKASVSLYFQNKLLQNYSYLNLTNREGISQLVQKINIDSLPTVTKLDQLNFHRVFGGEVSDQILLIYKKQHASSPEVQTVKQVFSKAAQFNKQKQLAYERVLFCEVDHLFFLENFNEQSQNVFKVDDRQLNYTIIFTKSDFDRYQLKRYTYRPNSSQPIHQEHLIQFIEDIRMKRLDPQYKSEKIPTQQQNNAILRKIVGKSFIQQVYQKPDQSIIIIFVDSKDPKSYQQAKTALQDFTLKYKSQIKDKLVTAIFDLDKNEHKLLYLKEAPQIILFDKSNKKKAVYYRFSQKTTAESIASWVSRQASNVQLNQQPILSIGSWVDRQVPNVQPTQQPEL